MNGTAQSAIEIASETGRLDFVSALLAILTLLLGLAAIPVFLMLRSKAAEVARRAADEKLKDAEKRVEELAIARLEALLPGLIEDYMQLAKSAVSGDDANAIAAAQASEAEE